MNKKLKEQIIELLQNEEDIPAEYQEILFPTTKKEYELKYAGKERKEKILNDTMSVPFQAIKNFGNAKEGDWVNKLIFGDNLQALKHLLKLKKEGKLKNADGTDGVRLVYIDPPFGTGDAYDAKGGVSAYSAKLKGAAFLEYLRKRIILLKEILAENGSIFIRIDYHFGHYLKVLVDEIFGKENFQNEIIINRGKVQMGVTNRYNTTTDSLYYYIKTKNKVFNLFTRKRTDKEAVWTTMMLKGERNPKERYFFDDKGKKHIILPIDGYHFVLKQEKINKMYERGYIKLSIGRKGFDSGFKEFVNGSWIKTDIVPRYFLHQPKVVNSNWTDISGYDQKWNYPTENSELLLERVIYTGSNFGDIVLDCFAGSGTTGAVAEKLGRRWIMADCGKLAIYTITKRMLNLKKEIGNKGDSLKPKPFVLYNAGLYYDGKLLEHMQRDEYKEFVLELFGCQKRDHEINGLDFHGTLNNHSVMVFDKEHYLTTEYIDQLHKTIGQSIKSNCFLIAPAGIVGFGEDYIKKGDKKYTVLRIPNSIIEYIRQKNFTRLEQPRTSEDVNQTIDSVGFDFIYPPKVYAEYTVGKPKGKLTELEYSIEIKEFEPIQLGSKIVEFKDVKSESLAMVMIDFDYDGDTFQMDKYWFGSDIVKDNFKIVFDQAIGKQIMIIYLDIFGNEKKEIIKKEEFIKG